jgi:hypothetical protein
MSEVISTSAFAIRLAKRNPAREIVEGRMDHGGAGEPSASILITGIWISELLVFEG